MEQQPAKPRQAKDSHYRSRIASYFHDAINLKMMYNNSNCYDVFNKTYRITDQKKQIKASAISAVFMKIAACASHCHSSGTQDQRGLKPIHIAKLQSSNTDSIQELKSSPTQDRYS